MKKLIFVLIILLSYAFTSVAADEEGFINVNKATVRKGPSTKHSVAGYLEMKVKIAITKKQGEWYQIRYGENKTGWINASLIRLVEKSNIKIEFLNINDKFKEYFNNNLLFLDGQLKGYDLENVKLAVSYSPDTNVARMTLIVPFDKKYYEEKKTKEIGGSFIDFMVYNDYLWGLVKYKTYIAESIEGESMDDFQAIMAFRANLLLLGDTGDSVILSGRFSGGYVVFNPHVDVTNASYNPIRVYTPDEESVEDKSIFYLPPARDSDGKLTSATILYNFFDIMY